MYKVLAGFVGLWLFVACSPVDNTKDFELNPKVNLQQRQAELKGLANFDLSKVIVARLKLDGKAVEVTSLKPVRLSEFKSDKGLSVTLLTFDKAKENLIFFSFDSLNNKGFEHKVLVSELQTKNTFSFPVVTGDGSIKTQVVTPVAVIIK